MLILDASAPVLGWISKACGLSLLLPVEKGRQTAGDVPAPLGVFDGKSGSCREGSQEGPRIPPCTKRLAS